MNVACVKAQVSMHVDGHPKFLGNELAESAVDNTDLNGGICDGISGCQIASSTQMQPLKTMEAG